MGTVALTTQCRSPSPPPSTADETVINGLSGRQTSTGTARPPSARVVSCGSTAPTLETVLGPRAGRDRLIKTYRGARPIPARVRLD
ncbi:hypothetical protein Sya03_16270 [Spirilliplanes yamanashiensis]|uniref:Uncharacterized protein n=1 Tax=Spirilliplanes yamanashiensis TaxID=42233 RepID=A0A8J3Y6M2_9ACTN|nr:hypothetical protein Sya03_16270 [Spirilliplanes yamanashiensis]